MKIRWKNPDIEKMEWQSETEFLKYVRSECCLTQENLAKSLKVSKVLITMVETGQKALTRKLLEKLQKKDGRKIEILIGD